MSLAGAVEGLGFVLMAGLVLLVLGAHFRALWSAEKQRELTARDAPAALDFGAR